MDTHQSRQSMIDAMAPPTRREDDSEAAMSDRPVLAVIPLPARLEVTAAVLGALADVWEDHHGQVLTMSDAPEESTPWGRALVIREPGPPAGPADGEVAPDTEKGALTPPLPTALAASIECVLLDHVDELDDDAGCVDANLAELAFVYRSLTGWDAKTETAVADDLAEARRRAERAEADRQRLLNLLGDLADEDPCQYDHHGGCQAHGYLWLADGERCPQAVAQEILAANPAPASRPEAAMADRGGSDV